MNINIYTILSITIVAAGSSTPGAAQDRRNGGGFEGCHTVVEQRVVDKLESNYTGWDIALSNTVYNSSATDANEIELGSAISIADTLSFSAGVDASKWSTTLAAEVGVSRTWTSEHSVGHHLKLDHGSTGIAIIKPDVTETKGTLQERDVLYCGGGIARMGDWHTVGSFFQQRYHDGEHGFLRGTITVNQVVGDVGCLRCKIGDCWNGSNVDQTLCSKDSANMKAAQRIAAPDVRQAPANPDSEILYVAACKNNQGQARPNIAWYPRRGGSLNGEWPEAASVASFSPSSNGSTYNADFTDGNHVTVRIDHLSPGTVSVNSHVGRANNKFRAFECYQGTGRVVWGSDSGADQFKCLSQYYCIPQ